MSDRTAPEARGPARSEGLRLARRQLPALALALVAGALAWRHLDGVDLASVPGRVAGIAPLSWLAAAGCVLASYLAAGAFEGAVHRHLATGVPPAEARRAGVVAAAVSQAVGAGLLSGTLARQRMLPALGAAGALRLTVSVALLFLGAWSVVTALALLAAPEVPDRVAAAAWALAVGLPLAALLWSLRGRGGAALLRAPTLPLLARLLPLAAADLAAAAACLALLLPHGAGPGLPAFLPAFLVAYGAGLHSGAPAGLGVFEVVFLTLLPPGQEAEILAAILAWRLVHHGMPFLIALAALAEAPAAGRSQPAPMLIARPPCLEEVLARSRRAEAGLLRQGDKLLLRLPGGEPGAVVARTGQTLTLIGEPLARTAPGAVVAALAQAAATEGRVPALYKAGARLAAAARRAGWRVVPVAEEACLSPAAFDPSGPECRQLRRKLRKAGAAGVTVEPVVARALPPALAEIAADWAAARGGERGFSMGRFAPSYLTRQRVFAARLQDRIVGFVTLHACAGEWTLDLLRACAEAPDGTLHALVAHAIDAAREEEVPRLSLAALPHPFLEGVLARLPGAIGRRLSGSGLAQFKAAFAPARETLYLAAPGGPALLLAAVEIARAIRWPGPLPAEHPAAASVTGLHHRHEGFRIARAVPACQEGR